jgi:hypothetical protein
MNREQKSYLIGARSFYQLAISPTHTEKLLTEGEGSKTESKKVLIGARSFCLLAISPTHTLNHFSSRS